MYKFMHTKGYEGRREAFSEPIIYSFCYYSFDKLEKIQGGKKWKPVMIQEIEDG